MMESGDTRSSDKRLIWEVLRKRGLITKIWTEDKVFEGITWNDLKQAPTFESITRARRKVQEQHPELQAVEDVKKKRDQLADGHPINIFSQL